MTGRDLPGRDEVAGRRHDDSRLTLHGLQHHGSHGVVDGGGQRFNVPERHERHVAGKRLERLAICGLVRDAQRAHRAAMEAVLGRDDPRPAGAPGDLERRLVGLGARVGEEDLGVVPEKG